MLSGVDVWRNVVEKSGSLPEADFGRDDCVAVESHFQIH
jgi:hypothetical protein